MNGVNQEIYIQGNVAILYEQLSINFRFSCWEKVGPGPESRKKSAEMIFYQSIEIGRAGLGG